MNTANTRNYVVRAIDIGYGNVKLVSDVVEGKPVCKCFDSIAVPADGINQGLGKYNVKKVSIPYGEDTVEYYVGHDAHLMSNTSDARPQHEDYVSTPQYEALMLGALSEMGVQSIDALVLGLPVRMFRRKEKILRERWKAQHVMSDGRTVTVRNVITVLQPMGGYMDYRNIAAGDRKDNFTARTLIVDPGWHTLDWMLIEGLTPLQESTGSNNMGVSGMLKRVANQISDDNQSDIPLPSSPLLTDVDSWIRGGEIVLNAGNHKTPIAPYMKSGTLYIENAIASMRSSVQERESIAEIVLVGGAARFYLDAIKKEFKGINIRIPVDPVYANVRGYQELGENACRQHAANSTKKKANREVMYEA